MKQNSKKEINLRKRLSQGVRYDVTLLTKDDLYLFNQGKHYRIYQNLGAHIISANGIDGTYFAVWAPNAQQVSVIGSFNNWDVNSHILEARDQSGIWEGFIPNIGKGTIYKYHIISKYNKYEVAKADPLAFYGEVSPRTASIVWNEDYQWSDSQWIEKRKNHNSLDKPISIYEMHLGSWRRIPEEANRPLSYVEMAPQLADYLLQMGFTHVEFMPVMEHPFNGSWGYQLTGYFAATSRYGTPQDLMYLIDYLHQRGIGVILDFVPSHFATDEHGLGYFDGTHLYEHEDPRQRTHPEWTSNIFNYGRNEVQSFLISSALFWLDKFHVDGLRVDGVASILYLNYARKEGEWIPNKYGRRENLEAIAFLRNLNEAIYQNYPDVQTIAEESSTWPMVSRPTYIGGLGFGLKWDMGWMHDSLEYLVQDPIYRKYHHRKLTFRMLYAFSENYVLPLSHDEVVHCKRSLLSKMPGNDEQKFANLRLLLGHMYAQSGKKLIFMGGEFGQWNEWRYDTSLDWHLLNYSSHTNLQTWVKDLNQIYRSERALYELDNEMAGFYWIDCNDANQSIISFIRQGNSTKDIILVVCNFTPIMRQDYILGVPGAGFWRELLNSDAKDYGGSGCGNMGGLLSSAYASHGFNNSLKLTLPPLSILFFKYEGIIDNMKFTANTEPVNF